MGGGERLVSSPVSKAFKVLLITCQITATHLCNLCIIYPYLLNKRCAPVYAVVKGQVHYICSVKSIGKCD